MASLLVILMIATASTDASGIDSLQDLRIHLGSTTDAHLLIHRPRGCDDQVLKDAYLMIGQNRYGHLESPKDGLQVIVVSSAELVVMMRNLEPMTYGWWDGDHWLMQQSPTYPTQPHDPQPLQHTLTSPNTATWAVIDGFVPWFRRRRREENGIPPDADDAD